MKSKGALDRIAKKYGETNSLEGTYDDFLAIKKDLNKLEQIEVLLPKYNNDEMHFTRGFDFINIVKEILEDDK